MNKKEASCVLIALYILFQVNFSLACTVSSDREGNTYTPSSSGPCGPKKFENGDLDQMTDSEWQQLKASDLKGKLHEVSDLSKLNQQELSSALQSQYGVTSGGMASGTKISKEGVLSYSGSNVDLHSLRGKNIETNSDKVLVDGKEYGKAENVKGTPDGAGVQAETLEYFNDGNVALTNGVNVHVYDDLITADHVDSFVTTSSISTNVDALAVHPTLFAVEKADSVISGCIEVNDAENSEFKIYSNAV